MHDSHFVVLWDTALALWINFYFIIQFHMNECCLMLSSIFSAISWREKVTFLRDNEHGDLRFVLDQHGWLDFYSAISLKKQSTRKYMLFHAEALFRLRAYQSLCSYSLLACMFSREATKTNFIVFGWPWLWFKPIIYRTQGQHGIITPLMQSSYEWHSQLIMDTILKGNIDHIHFMKHIVKPVLGAVFSFEAGNRHISPAIAIKSLAMNFPSMGMFKNKLSCLFYFNSVSLSFAGMYSRSEHGII